MNSMCLIAWGWMFMTQPSHVRVLFIFAPVSSQVIVNMIWAAHARNFICPRAAHFCRLVDDLRLVGDRRSAQFLNPVAEHNVDAQQAEGATVPMMDHFW
jgi:hypothetical protein